jgi:hypothetical protein
LQLVVATVLEKKVTEELADLVVERVDLAVQETKLVGWVRPIKDVVEAMQLMRVVHIVVVRVVVALVALVMII